MRSKSRGANPGTAAAIVLFIIMISKNALTQSTDAPLVVDNALLVVDVAFVTALLAALPFSREFGSGSRGVRLSLFAF